MKTFSLIEGESKKKDQHEAQYDDENCAKSESTVLTGDRLKDRLVDPHLVDSGLIPKKKEQEADEEEESKHERVQWDKQREFILSVAGGFIGLGNVWRFPYLCYKNGGGAFLIPYCIFLVIGGIPIFLMEVALGQFMSRGGIEAWNLVPIFKGIGWASLVIVFWLNVYYIVILAWNLFYLFQAFDPSLPWTRCDGWWNTPCCSSTSVNGTLIKPAGCNESVDFPENEFWKNRVLQLTDDLGTPGGMQWELVGTLVLSWMICYACIWKGVKSTGKSVYVTSTFPLIMLLVLLVRGLTLPGAKKGIEFYIKPDWARLTSPDVWKDAGTQIFFSYAICLGSQTSLGSYNKFSFNSFKWGLILSGFNSGASIVSGFAIFSVLGYMAQEIGCDVSEVAEKGPGLAFIAYPRALSMMAFPQIWSLLFFIMILLLGLASQYVAVEGMCTMIVDLKPRFWFKTPYRRPLCVAAACCVCFVFALPMVTRGGIYVFQLADTYGASGLCLLWVAFFETSVISWIYGIDNFYKDLDRMFGHKFPITKRPWQVFGFLWKYGSPIMCASTFAYIFVDWNPTTYNNYVFPVYGELIGICMACSSILLVPIYAVYRLITTPGTLAERWEFLTTPVFPRGHPYTLSRSLSPSSSGSNTDPPSYHEKEESMTFLPAQKS